MTFITKTLRNAAVGVGLAETPEGLNALKKPGCAAVIWQRDVPQEVLSWLGRLDPDHLPRGRIVLRKDMVAEAVRNLCDIVETPNCPERKWLVADIARMSDVFANLMSTEHLRLRLGVVTNNACRKFHIDHLTARLVCTYRGSGTQYGISPGGDDPSRVFQVPTGAPILLRGTQWPADPPSGLLHRSPPIEGTGETRLVLVLDPISEMDAEFEESDLLSQLRAPKTIH